MIVDGFKYFVVINDWWRVGHTPNPSQEGSVL